MYCPRCGTNITRNVEYCPHCGANIKDELARYNFNPVQESTIEIEKQPTHEEQYQYSLEYSYGNKDDFIKAYIGKNYDKIKSQKFSFPTFFLGSIYFFYRKLYALGLIWMIVIFILGIMNLAFLLMGQIILACSFSKIYLNIVKNRIKAIAMQNKRNSQDEIITQCKQKGGTNIILPFLLVFIILGSIGLIINIEINTKQEYKKINEKTVFKIGNISYTIPEGYTLYYESDEYQAFNKYDPAYCSITIQERKNSTLYNSEEEYLKSNLYTKESDIVSPITTLTINNETWTQISIQTEYRIQNTYVLKKSKTIYEIETTDNTSQNCKEELEQILNSITYQKEQ